MSHDAPRPRPIPQLRPDGGSGPFRRSDLRYQAVSRKAEDAVSYEFFNAYDAPGRIVEGESLWLVTTLSDDGRSLSMDWLAYGPYCEAVGREAVPFRAFGARNTTPACIRKWMRDPRTSLESATNVRQTPSGAAHVESTTSAHDYEKRLAH